jgi:hypothetical protein
MNTITDFCVLRKGNVITRHDVESFETDAIEAYENALYEKLGLSYPRFYKMDHQCRLGMLACEFLLKDNRLKYYSPEEVAIVLTNANASADADIAFVESMQTMASPALFVYTLSNIVMAEICIRHNIKGENAFYITPAFDATLLQGYVDMVLRQPQTQACIAGWIEVSGGQYDVCLYLVEREGGPLSFPHTTDELKRIYTK